MHKVVAVHLRLLKQLAGPGEVLFIKREIPENLFLKPVGVFAVELFAERLALVEGDLTVADLLRGVVGCAADAVLDVGCVIEKIVDLVVDRVVFRIRPLRALGRGAEAPVLDRVIVRPLRVPLFVIAEIPHLDVVFLKVRGLGRQIDRKVGLVDLVIFFQLAQADPAEVDVVVIVDGEEMLVPQSGVVVGNRVAELGLVLAVKDKRDAELGGHLGRKLLLPQDKRLERMEQVFGRQAGQKPVGHAVRGAEVVIKPGVNPCLHILPAPGGVDMRGPGHGQRVHPVFVFEQMGRVKAVFAAGAGHQAVVAAVRFPVFVAELAQFLFAQRPVNPAVGLVVAGVAGVADAVVLDDHRLFLGFDRVLKLIAGVRLLVAHHALFAKAHLLRQSVIGFQLIFGDVGVIF